MVRAGGGLTTLRRTTSTRSTPTGPLTSVTPAKTPLAVPATAIKPTRTSPPCVGSTPTAASTAIAGRTATTTAPSTTKGGIARRTPPPIERLRTRGLRTPLPQGVSEKTPAFCPTASPAKWSSTPAMWATWPSNYPTPSNTPWTAAGRARAKKTRAGRIRFSRPRTSR